MRNAGLDEAQPGIKIARRLTSKIKHLCTSWKKKKIAGRNINNLRYTDDTSPLQKAKKN